MGGICGSTPWRSEKSTNISTQQSVQERPSGASPPAIGQWSDELKISYNKFQREIGSEGRWLLVAYRETAFFDVGFTHVDSKTNQGKPTAAIFKEREREKERKYQQKVLVAEMGSFTPLIFGTNGEMGEECK